MAEGQVYAIVFHHDGNSPDEMNTSLIGPLFPDGKDDERVREVFEPGQLILEPEPFEDDYQHIMEDYGEVAE